MARKRFRVEWCLHRLLCAGLLGLALLALPASSGAVEESESTQAATSGSVDDADRTAEEYCSFWGLSGRASDRRCVWDGYDSKQAGHPLRIAAYVLHPVGVIIDRLIFRPAWWVGSHEPFYTLFGRTD